MDLQALRRDETRLDSYIAGETDLFDGFIDLGIKFLTLKQRVSETRGPVGPNGPSAGLGDAQASEEQQRVIEVTYRRMGPAEYRALLLRAGGLLQEVELQPQLVDPLKQALASVGYWCLLCPGFDLNALQRGALVARTETSDFYRLHTELLDAVEAEIGKLPFARWGHSNIVISGLRVLALEGLPEAVHKTSQPRTPEEPPRSGPSQATSPRFAATPCPTCGPEDAVGVTPYRSLCRRCGAHYPSETVQPGKWTALAGSATRHTPMRHPLPSSGGSAEQPDGCLGVVVAFLRALNGLFEWSGGLAADALHSPEPPRTDELQSSPPRRTSARAGGQAAEANHRVYVLSSQAALLGQEPERTLDRPLETAEVVLSLMATTNWRLAGASDPGQLADPARWCRVHAINMIAAVEALASSKPTPGIHSLLARLQQRGEPDFEWQLACAERRLGPGDEAWERWSDCLCRAVIVGTRTLGYAAVGQSSDPPPQFRFSARAAADIDVLLRALAVAESSMPGGPLYPEYRVAILEELASG